MPTNKISDLPSKFCNHPEHNPPMHQLFDNGIYEHTCPSCGAKKKFIVNRPTFEYDDENPDYITGTEDGI